MNYKILTLILIILGLSLWVGYEYKQETPAAKADAQRHQTEALYITPQGEVTDAIVRLMGLTGIRVENGKAENDWPEPKLTLKSRSLEEVVGAVQGKVNASITWFGDITKERWENDISKPKLSPNQARTIIQTCLTDLHQKDKTVPSLNSPKAVLFLGATLPRVRLRLAYLNELYSTLKVSPTLPVYILTGERQLDPKIGETAEGLTNPHNGTISFRKDWVASSKPLTDEGDMINLVFAQSRHQDLDAKNIHMAYSSKGEGRRANAETNTIQWLKEYLPVGGNYIAVSNQPYNFFLECVIRRTLLKQGRSDIHVEVVGGEMEVKLEDDEEAVKQAKNLLNNLSRILYELLEIQKFERTN